MKVIMTFIVFQCSEKMKALAMHLLEAQGWERVKDIRESLTEPMLTSAITPRWGSLMSARL